MATLSQSSVFESLFQSALIEYENQTGINLLRHPIAVQLERCSSVESVTEVLQQQAQAFREFRGSNNRIATLLRHTVQIIHKLSAHVVRGEDIVLPISFVKTIHTCIGTLLSTVKDVSASYDALVDLLESISNFLRRLDIYTKIPPTMAMTELIVKILVQLISTLAVATKQIKQGRLKKLERNFLEIMT
ncbi:hypothetical protein BJV74DRAFT_508193 [Russula compacta]|nr:hypothetical protein BJV74DRAFT_508193 [Russula compacta]